MQLLRFSCEVCELLSRLFCGPIFFSGRVDSLGTLSPPLISILDQTVKFSQSRSPSIEEIFIDPSGIPHIATFFDSKTCL